MQKYEHMHVAEQESALVVTVADAVMYQAEAIELEGELLDLVADFQPTNVVLRFPHLDYSSSSLVSTLLMVSRTIADYGGELTLSDLQPHLQSKLEVLNLAGSVFEIG